MFLRLAILVELRLVTDTQTDRQTDTRPWHIPREQSSLDKKYREHEASAVERWRIDRDGVTARFVTWEIISFVSLWNFEPVMAKPIKRAHG